MTHAEREARRVRKRMCTSKKRYRDHNEAISSGQTATARRGTTLRVYECPWCDGFHLTKEKR